MHNAMRQAKAANPRTTRKGFIALGICFVAFVVLLPDAQALPPLPIDPNNLVSLGPFPVSYEVGTGPVNEVYSFLPPPPNPANVCVLNVCAPHPCAHVAFSGMDLNVNPVGGVFVEVGWMGSAGGYGGYSSSCP
jgi:hypothetical protein